MNEETRQQATEAQNQEDAENRHPEDEQQEPEGSPEQEQQAAQDTAAEQAGDGGGEQSVMDRLAEAEKTVTEQHEEMLRLRAEMQNIQRRTEQEVEKARKYGLERFATELLGVIDNLERALEAVPDREDEQVKALYEGVELTLKSFRNTLAQFNIEAIDPLGEPFDPQLHEAMTMQDNDEVEPNTVVAVMQKGYTLHGRVIRPARVIVARASSGGAGQNA